MARTCTVPLVLAACAGLFATKAHAGIGCNDSTAVAADTASRIAAVACAEHELWFAPFIDENGRLASMRVSEAEGLRLRDGATPAWRRVAAYWRDSGVRWPSPDLPAGADCAAPAGATGAALCRTFLVDAPWSAVFVSYVMTRAGVPGFQPSARHVDYVRDAFRDDGRGPYRLADPDTDVPAAGDLACFARTSAQVFGVQGFRDWLARSSGGPLAMHCDIVVSTTGNRARLVGGNVLQGVTMRVLPLNRLGRFWSLPRRTGREPECHPANPAACNLNRQDWVALLKLNPIANVAAPQPPTATGTTPASGHCCIVCMLPMPAGLRRCPAPADTSPVTPVSTPAPSPIPPPTPTPSPISASAA